MSKILVLLLLIASLQSIYSYRLSDADLDQDEDQELRAFVEKQEASEFFKRFLHPFSTKNEEQKRETVEVYEEKCRSIVPTQRFCPKLKTWQAFKNYENGE